MGTGNQTRAMQVTARRVDWEFKTPFRIAYRTRTHAQTVLVQLREDGVTGRGEALGVSYRGETVDSLLAQIAAVERELSNGLTRDQLQKLLPPGGARNAIDCALWDLECKRTKRRAWELAGIQSVRPLQTTYTLSIDTPEAMASAAAAVPQYPVLKLKLAGENDLQRVEQVRRARPDARLVVDANQAWSEQHLQEWVPAFGRLGVELIEQPLPIGKDEALGSYRGAIPLCADESCQTVDSLSQIAGKYQYINIKLDKTGGLTEALRLAEAAKAAGLKLMTGCMGGSSLSMASAFVVGQLCELVDLDGPLLSKSDVDHAIRYDGNRMSPPVAALWG